VPFQFDDPYNISEKPFVRDIGVFYDPKFNTPGSTLVMRTAGFFTFAVNYWIHGKDVVGYHIVNLAVHILNGFLVYFLVLLTFKTPYFSNPTAPPLILMGGRVGLFIPLFSALLFVSHPIQTQAVTYIVQRFTSLATLFYLLSLVMYIRWRLLVEQKRESAKARKGGKENADKAFHLKSAVFYLTSLLSAVLAMKSKEIAFTLPMVIALYEFLFFHATVKRRVLYLLPPLLTMLIIPIELLGLEKPTGEVISDVSEAMRVGSSLSRGDYLFTEFRVIVTYIRLLFFPVNQNLDYDYPIYRSFSDPNVFLSFLLLFSIFCAAAYLLFKSRQGSISYKSLEKKSYILPLIPYSRLTAFGIFWFLIALSVESSVIPMSDVIFEHRLYLPSVGFFIAVTVVLFMVWERLKGKAEWAGKAAAGGLLAVIILLSGATYARNTVWQSELSLWTDVLRKSPDKVRAHNNVGLAVMNQGDTAGAADMYIRAIAIDPNVAEPHYNLGKVYEKKGLYDKAMEEYKKAVSLRPDFADAYFDLGVIYASRGMRDEAIMNYRAALKAEPDYAMAHFNIGVIYMGKNLPNEAGQEFEAALRIDPSMDQARQFLEYVRKLR
jgi:tetratricopeptide (TPR) repeat protein